jgi:SAM-dependent methyltransferase
MSNYESELSALYAHEARTREEPYLHYHSRNSAVIRRQVRIFERCKDVLTDAHTILDWGCRHGADACMVRMFRGTGVELYGCDVHAIDYHTFYDFAGLKYSQLIHPYRLPYEDNFFDAVIGGGVLEHVPNDSECLKELYRVIRPQGHFIMTFLPNKYSYTEWLSRRLHRPHHPRMYVLSAARSMFMHHGFRPIRFGYHQVLPTLAGQKDALFDLPLVNRLVEQLSGFDPILERLWPVNRIATNIFIIGRKEEVFWE